MEGHRDRWILEVEQVKFWETKQSFNKAVPRNKDKQVGKKLIPRKIDEQLENLHMIHTLGSFALKDKSRLGTKFIGE